MAGDLGVVAIDEEPTSFAGEPTGFTGEPNSDFHSGEFRPLGSVSAEDKSEASLVGLTTLAFFFNLLGIGGEGCAVVYVAIEEATGWVAGGGVGGVSLLASLDAVAAALEPLSNLFMEEAPPRVLTIFVVLREKKTSKAKNKKKGKGRR